MGQGHKGDIAPLRSSTKSSLSGYDDKIVTSFCKAKTPERADLATPVHGRGEGVGTRVMKRLSPWNWCRRCAACLALMIVGGCADDLSDTKVQPPAPVTKPTPSEPVITVVEDSRHTFYRGYLADVLAGDREEASNRYQEVLGAGAEEPSLVAHAALRLAIWAEANRQRVVAADLAVRASVLGSGTPYIRTEADQLRRRLAQSGRSQGGIKVRGPKPGTVLRGVPKTVAAQFAVAEMLLAAYHRFRLKPRLEALGASIQGKRTAMQRAVSAYREVVESGVPMAILAAQFRIASIYHDYSLSLSFELPDELDPQVARRLRSSLQSEVRQIRARARSAYVRSLEANKGRSGAQVSTWADASSRGLASIRDLLRRQ